MKSRWTWAGAGLAAVVAAGVVGYEIVAPRLDWSALAKPGRLETRLAGGVIGGWVRLHATEAKNPYAATPENLAAGRREYGEHCAVCHGLMADGDNELEADTYPPIPSLLEAVKRAPDGALYFIVSKGIRYSAMPGFEKHHGPDDIWRIILWVRHLSALNPEEKAKLEAEVKAEREEHEATMGRGGKGKE